MKLADSNDLLRGFGLARLGIAALLLAVGPMLPEELMPGTNRGILALALLVVAGSSGVLVAFAPLAQPHRVAWLVCLLDTALVTAVVAATGGARSIFAFLYVLSVTAACLLLSRTGGLAIAAASSALYTGLVFGRTVFPMTAFFEAPKASTALEIVTIFMNAGTFLILAYISGVPTTILSDQGPLTIAQYLHVAHIDGATELAVFAAALFGSGIGFLWYNTYPAQVFMGDVGALGIGGAIGMLAVLTKNELVLLIVGGLFVVEALSVIIQTGVYKATKRVENGKVVGKRVFAMAPIHHHYEKIGWDEPKIIVRFWLVSALLALLALGTLKMR